MTIPAECLHGSRLNESCFLPILTRATAQHCIHPTRAVRGRFWRSGIAKQIPVQPSRLDPRERVMLTLGGFAKFKNRLIPALTV